MAENNRVITKMVGMIDKIATTTTIECQVCLETKTLLREQVRMIDGSPLCPECAQEAIVPLFEKAYLYEIEWPPRWGNTEIDFDQFADLLSPEVRECYENKVEEYETPIPMRVYCKYKETEFVGTDASPPGGFCNAFLGSTDEMECFALVECPCGGTTCLNCRECTLEPELHKCEGRKEDEDESEIVNDSNVGEKFQRCPEKTCRTTVELRDGCNAVDCPFCKTTFCFICSQKTRHNSDHWSVGNPCPRYGQPEAENAIYDGDDDDDGEDDEQIDNEDFREAAVVLAAELRETDDFREAEARRELWAWADRLVALEEQGKSAPQPGSNAFWIRRYMHGFAAQTWLEHGQSLRNAPEALRRFHVILMDLHANIMHIAQVNAGERAWNRTVRDGVAKAEETVRALDFRLRHEALLREFGPAFVLALHHIGPMSILLELSDTNEMAYRLEEVFDGYVAQDAAQYFVDIARQEADMNRELAV